MELSSFLHTLLILVICIGLSIEQTTREEQRSKKKSRRKRRGCKCIHRYMAEVDKLIESKLHDFKASYVVPTQKEKRHAETQRMRDALLRLSGDVAETKTALRDMTTNFEEMMKEMDSTRRDCTTLHQNVNTMSIGLANLTKQVDSIEQRLTYRASALVDSGGDMTHRKRSSTASKKIPKHCQEVFEQGGMKFRGDYYIMIQPKNQTHAFKALCRMVNNSGWTLIQRRQDGSVDFFRSWEDYRRGFGSLEGEFWLGNDNIHYLTNQVPSMLRIEMEDWNQNFYYAEYDYFRVGSLETKYRLSISGYRGTAGNSMTSAYENHNGMAFSTKDMDNDARYYDSCAKHYKSGWWFNNCFDANLNGVYYHKGFHKNFFQRDGVQWNSVHMYSSLRTVQMMVKPANHVSQTSDYTAKPHAATTSAGGDFSDDNDFDMVTPNPQSMNNIKTPL